MAGHARILTLLLLLMVRIKEAVGDQEGVREVWVVTGRRADLPCEPRPKHRNDQPVLVLWYLSSTNLPVYSYDARVGDFNAGSRWADEEVLGDRAYFSSHASPPALVLNPVSPRDQGLYSCRVDYRFSPSTTVAVNLTVAVPPGPPALLWNGVEVVGGEVGPVQEGAVVEVVCRSVGGRPPPVVTWWWGGTRLPHQTSAVTTQGSSGEVVVSSKVVVVAERELQAATLTCHARTPAPALARPHAFLQPRSATLTLNITLPPLEVVILGSGGPVSAGSLLQQVCRVAGSNPAAEVTWWHGHSHLTQVTHTLEDGGNVTKATVSLVVQRQQHGTSLACTATNPLLPHHPITTTLTLNVYYAPVVSLSLGEQINPSLIKEGDDVFFECRVQANPLVQSIFWYHNGVEVEHDVEQGVVVSGLSLVVRRLQRHHSGSYACAATNIEGRNISNPVHLNIQYAPVCAGGLQDRTLGAPRGFPSVVTCRVEADPPDGVTWTWAKKLEDGTEVELPVKDVQMEGLTSSVVLVPRTLGDYGQVQCRASNAIGKQREPCLVTLVPAGPPDSPINCSTSSSALTSPSSPGQQLAVTCVEGFDGGLPQSFLLEAWQDGKIVANLSSDYPEWVVGRLAAGRGLTLRVVAHNARGRSPALRLEVHTATTEHHTAPETEEPAVVGLPVLLGAGVGVAVVVVLLLVVGVVLARHACPHHHHHPKAPPSHSSPSHSLVDDVGEWPTYDPDLVISSANRRRHASLDVLSQAYQQREVLVRSQSQVLRPIHQYRLPRTSTQPPPHCLTNGQILNKVPACEKVEIACQVSDSCSGSSCDSDINSVVEVPQSTRERNGRSASLPHSPSPGPHHTPSEHQHLIPRKASPAAPPADTRERQRPNHCHTDVNPIARFPQPYINHSRGLRNTENNKTYDGKPLKMRDKVKLVRFSEEQDMKQLSGSQTTIPIQNTNSRYSPITYSSRENVNETEPPPKPPRSFSLSSVSENLEEPQSSVSSTPKTSSSTAVPTFPISPVTTIKERPVTETTPQLSKANFSVAPLAQDEVSDAYCHTPSPPMGIIESTM